MSVTPLRPDITTSPLKQQYLDYVAQQYDAFIDYSGKEPDALAFGFCDLTGASSTHWLMPNEPQGSNRCALLLSNIVVELFRHSAR